MLERDGEIIFPMAIARRARIISDHGRAALPKCKSRGARKKNRNR
jgi:hypothetical protein